MHGQTVLGHVLQEVSRTTPDEIILVLGAQAEEVLQTIDLKGLYSGDAPPVQVVINPEPEHGQSQSLQLGLLKTNSHSAAAMIFLGDQPGLAPEISMMLLEALQESRHPILRPLFTGSGASGLPGHPVLLDRSIWDEIHRLSGDQGARQLIRKHPDWVREVPVSSPFPPDLDTWEDYQRALGQDPATDG